jgi:hypothetical protein
MEGGENQKTTEINTRFHHTSGTSLNAQIVFQISACFFAVIFRASDTLRVSSASRSSPEMLRSRGYCLTG